MVIILPQLPDPGVIGLLFGWLVSWFLFVWFWFLVFLVILLIDHRTLTMLDRLSITEL